MPYCAALNCTNRASKRCGKTFHRFPKTNHALREQWTINMRRNDWTPKPYATLCSDHFEEKYFDRTGQTTRLRENAVPTLFNFAYNPFKSFRLQKVAKPEVRPEDKEVICSQPVTQCRPCFPQKDAKPEVQPEHKGKEDSHTSTIDEHLALSADQACDTPASSDCSTAVRPVPEGIDGFVLIAPKTPSEQPTCNSQRDHTYSISESAPSVKRQLNKMHDHMSDMKKRLKKTQSRARRLKKQVDFLQDILKTLREKNMLSASGLEMLEKTCHVHRKITRRLTKSKEKDATLRKECPPARRAFAPTLNL
ncbi:THAP domain-containing protein 1-like [Diadema setosum]|uniref:THAP domain-containing protein 1-like n=1 Tax=Diadema setosum TaxID=31175 RepID=UPI003B3B7139